LKGGLGARGGKKHGKGKGDGRGLAEAGAAAVAEQNPMLGVGALVLAAICTAFASVYFEKMLKGASKPSLWLRNIQLAVYCSVIAVVGVLARQDPMISTHGWMYGFTFFTWLSVAWQAAGGLLVAVTIKYADNILRGFSQGLALIVGAIGSAFLFDFKITYVFSMGCALVIAAIFLYGSSAQTPQELCESICGTAPAGVRTDYTEVAKEVQAGLLKESPADGNESNDSSGSTSAPVGSPSRV